MKNTLQARSGSVGFGFSVLVGLLGIACSDSTLTSHGLLDSGAGGAVSSGGMAGPEGGAGGANPSGTGGKGGAGGTTCPSIDCAPLNCPNGTMPNPSNPCGCAVCTPSDAGASKDASPDVCWALPCDPEICSPGKIAVERPCSCPICMEPDAGQADAPVCPRTCPPAVRCDYGTIREPVCGCTTCLVPDGGPEAGSGPDAIDAAKDGSKDSSKDSSVDVCLALPCAIPLCAAGYSIVEHACGCPTCEPSDAGVDSGKLACVGLDECACMASDSCSVVSDACYCPFPQCGSGACVCGGGKFLGCVPAGLNTCAAAKARVATLCPTLKGATFDGLCQQTDAACITKCLDDVTACGDVSCSFCEACDCVSDPFARCVSTCKNALKP